MYYDIVIVGGGAGGLELAARLGRYFGRVRGPEKVLLIDRSSYHIWKPTLHEVAVGTLNPQQEGLSYSILGRSNHFSYMPGELLRLDAPGHRLTLAAVYDDHRELIIPERELSFGQCVLALGSGSNFFGTPGSEHAFVLEQAADAQRFQRHLLNLFARAAYSRERLLNVGIVGGGATGVELAAELVEAYRAINESVGSAQRFRIHITLLEASPRLLNGLPERVARGAEAALHDKQVEVLTSTPVKALHADHIETASGTIPTDVIVWAAGIKAAERNRDYGLTTNRLNQFEVDSQLRTSAKDIYALGDCAACPWAEGRQVPARAAAAHQQAAYLYKVLRAQSRGKKYEKPYVYRELGSLISLGDRQGVGNLSKGRSGGNLFIEGLIAKYMYMSLHLAHHKAILGYRKTALLALARAAQNRVSGRLKLH